MYEYVRQGRKVTSNTIGDFNAKIGIITQWTARNGELWIWWQKWKVTETSVV